MWTERSHLWFVLFSIPIQTFAHTRNMKGSCPPGCSPLLSWRICFPEFSPAKSLTRTKVPSHKKKLRAAHWCQRRGLDMPRRLVQSCGVATQKQLSCHHIGVRLALTSHALHSTLSNVQYHRQDTRRKRQLPFWSRIFLATVMSKIIAVAVTEGIFSLACLSTSCPSRSRALRVVLDARRLVGHLRTNVLDHLLIVALFCVPDIFSDCSPRSP